MKCLVLTDLHRGISRNTWKIHEHFAYQVLALLDWDVLVLCGDTASHRKSQFKGALKFWRKFAGDKPIVLVRGNHDHWEKGQRSITSLLDKLHEEWFVEFGIHHLENAPFELGDYTIVGFGGWYKGFPETNDLHFMARWCEGDTWRYLQKRSNQKFDAALAQAEEAKDRGQVVMAVTHFPIVDLLKYDWQTDNDWQHWTDPMNRLAAITQREAYSGFFSYWDYIKPHINALCFGHTHKFLDINLDGVRVINAGSDYDKPRFALVDLSPYLLGNDLHRSTSL